MKKRKQWYDYLWLWEIIYFSLGFFNILFAWLGMIDFIVPLLYLYYLLYLVVISSSVTGTVAEVGFLLCWGRLQNAQPADLLQTGWLLKAFALVF